MLSHDQNFKNLFCDYLLDRLRFLLPDATAHWPADVRVSLIRQEQLKARLGDTFCELDLPVRVEFPDGPREALVIVIENESRDRAEFLHYLAIVSIAISMQQKTRRVVPVAFYPFRSKPLLETFSLGDDERNYLDFSCRSCVLGTMLARDFEFSRNIVARLCLPLMARDPEEKLRMIVRAYEGMLELEPDFGKRIKYSEFIGMYAQLDKDEELQFRKQYAEGSPYKEDIMSLTDIWQEQGEVRGLAKGIEKGEAIGRVKAIVQLHADGILSADQARTQLHALSVKSNVPQALVDDALLQIQN